MAKRCGRCVWLVAGAVILVVVAACGGDDASTEPPPLPSTSPASGASGTAARFPDVLEVEVNGDGDAFSFRVTLSSLYDTRTRYADGWRIKDADGNVYGEHTLLHSHEGEQPFTRTQSGVAIPPGVTSVIVEGRDIVSGYGGATVTTSLPGRAG